MNKIKGLALALFAMLISLTSCEGEWIDSELNIDPDAPSDVPMNLLLPGIQQSMGYNLMGNNSVRTNNIWMQIFDGVSRQSFTEARYQLTPADVNNLWINTYTEMMMNTTILVQKSRMEGSESPHYTGIGQVMQATTLGITTDLFGDVPFSDAFEGSRGNLTPVYDEQQKVYDTIFTLLDNAVPNLNSSENTFAVSGDVIYGGNLAKWEKAANSIKARHYLQLSNVLGNEAYTKALAAAQDGFESNADDYLVPFEDSNRNPIFQFMEQRGDIRMGATLVDLLVSNDDPRLEFYVEANGDGEFVGSEIGSQNESASAPGPAIAGTDQAVKLMTYSELKFIEAEAHFRLGQTTEAQAAYEAAVAASLLRVTGEDQSDWIASNLPGMTLESILTQKYIDGVGTNQPYADWRRTGLPSLELAPGAVTSSIPTRFPYAQNELDYNRANVPTVTITDKVWWDQ
ncbi:SusD/RagB family nutrient-binding outer membrane lipoprotein [Christiangramia sabulilitoris]|nr:SusD/RagB family nutrient-binding outer membrane lipoprotein [Christiangramia sabulilitoris]